MMMAFVEKQLFPIAFTGGIDTKTDPHQVLAGNLLSLQNGQFSQKGQINKRYGYTALSRTIEGSSSSITTGKAVQSFNNELLLMDGNSIYSYINTTGTWINRGNAQSVISNTTKITRSSAAQQLNPDVCYCNGMNLYVYEDSRGGIRYSVRDTRSGSIIVSDVQIGLSGSYQKPKVVSFQNQFIIFYNDSSSHALYYQIVSPKNPTVIQSQTLLLNDGYTNFSFDATVVGSRIFVAYLSNYVASGQISAFYLDTQLNKSLTTVIESSAGKAINTGYSSALNICSDSNTNLWISWLEGQHVRTSCYSYNLVQVLADTVVDTVQASTLTGCESPSAGTLQLTYEVYNANQMNTKIVSKTITKTGTVSTVGTLRSVGLASKAFKLNSQIYAMVTFQSPLQSTYFCVNITAAPFSIISKTSSGTGGGLRTNNTLSEVAWQTSTLAAVATLQKGQVLSESLVIFTLLGVCSTSLDFSNIADFLSVTSSNNLLLGGGILQSYDGNSFVEHLFHLYPENVLAVASGSDGYLSAGTYQYQVTYEWMDSYGQIQRSSPSPTVTVNAAANNHITLTIPTLRLTAKQNNRSNVNIVIYRTAANGVVFNQVTSNLSPLLNDTTVDTVTFTDYLSDNSISANAYLYTTGGVLPNSAPPSCSLITAYQNRVIVGGLDDPNLLWFSQNRFDNSSFNTLPVEFSASLTIGVDPRGGAITALGLLNNNLIIFKKTAIFVLNGDGPNATGGGDQFPDPQMISSDIGCNNPNSVVIFPGGLIFQSDKGIYLLDQALNVSYIGAPVEQYNSNVITSSSLIPNTNQVVFVTNTGTTLVYDYYFQQWSTWTNQYAVDSDTTPDGSFYYIQSNGMVMKQTPGSYTDNGAPIPLSFVTPNLSFAGLNGYQRVFRAYILGTYKGVHNLLVNVAYDNNPTYTQSATVLASQGTTIYGDDSIYGESSPFGGEYNIYEFRIDFSQQLCTSIRLQISDSQSSNYNEGYSISAITFEVGALPGGNRLPASSTYGTK